MHKKWIYTDSVNENGNEHVSKNGNETVTKKPKTETEMSRQHI